MGSWPGSGGPAPKDRGELSERGGSISFVLTAPGHLPNDFRVTADRGVLRIVAAPDFVARPLACRVDTRAVAAEHRDGVLGVRIPKRF